MKTIVKPFALLLGAFAFLGCNPKSNKETQAPSNSVLTLFLDSLFEAHLQDDPQYQTTLGIRKQDSLWTDASDAFQQKGIERTRRDLAALQNRFDRSNLSGQDAISYDLFVQTCREQEESFPFRFHNYPLNQMEGLHASIPSFLINMHTVEEAQDARTYLGRLGGIPKQLRALEQQLETRLKLGILPPKFVFPKVEEDCQNLIKGKPFDNSSLDSPLLEDFSNKVKAIKNLPSAEADLLLKRAKELLIDSVGPAYRNLINYWKTLAAKADDRDGAWKLPNGDKFYAMALRHTTTTSLTPEQIHEIGLREVARIHAEMEIIKEKVGFKGSLKEFFTFMRTSKKFYFPSSEEGKQSYLSTTNTIIDGMRSKLDQLFITKPKAALVVKPVEPFRERSAGGAFYEEPALDGSRPGRYYINLYTLNDQPTYQMEALAYHEAIPGHHMQIAIAQELKGLPRFRTLGGNTAYVEGWALYAEKIPKEIGLYTDPYSDFGRLAMEVFRASRLVIDTGIHHKKWTRKNAYQYMIDNTPNPEGDSQKEIDRYIVWPGQATGYKIGMIKILELRTKAQKALGSKFDLRAFHDVVLTNGSLPLNMLENQVDQYINKTKGS
jgi:uncharacterized protein (DUF885 family)